ncbi:endonuclease domain-containing protein [candidate division KSB1 bacterium]|nr:endonuclease domain-containing protein [candidate division KSB1 bacterium]MBL7095702.1 endonuclease domain-containing protein [candidate division KSB1 bacterium]
MPPNPIIPYNPKLKELARELRKNPTYAEKILWHAIRRKQLGVEFHRQVPINQFIVDFYCHELKLAIEVDGVSHSDPDVKNHDTERQSRLESLGVRFLRFEDDKVLGNVENVVGKIKEWIEENMD